MSKKSIQEVTIKQKRVVSSSKGGALLEIEYTDYCSSKHNWCYIDTYSDVSVGDTAILKSTELGSFLAKRITQGEFSRDYPIKDRNDIGSVVLYNFGTEVILEEKDFDFAKECNTVLGKAIKLVEENGGYQFKKSELYIKEHNGIVTVLYRNKNNFREKYEFNYTMNRVVQAVQDSSAPPILKSIRRFIIGLQGRGIECNCAGLKANGIDVYEVHTF